MISEYHRALNRQLMAERPTWAGGGHRHRDVVLQLVEQYKCQSVLDFGCGRGTLGHAVMGDQSPRFPHLEWYDYDPAIPGKQWLPTTADLVVTTHSLEHVEPHYLDETLEQIGDIAQRAIYVAVPHGLANAVLPDGRNAHLIVRPHEWWFEKLRSLGAVTALVPTTFLNGSIRDESRYVVEIL